MPSAAWSLALIGPGFFFLVLPMGTAGAALQLIFPNQVRAQVSALYLFILNLGGLTLGPLMPGVFADYLFKDPKMIGAGLSLTMAVSGVLMLVIILATRRPYRAALPADESCCAVRLGQVGVPAPARASLPNVSV